jgi:hypothetical protein
MNKNNQKGNNANAPNNGNKVNNNVKGNNQNKVNNKPKTNNVNNKFQNNLNKLNQTQNNILNSASEILSNNTNLNSINNNIAKLQSNLELLNDDQEPFYIRHKKLLFGLAIVLGIILFYILGKYIYKKFFDKTSIDKQMYLINNIASTSEKTIPNEELVEPRSGFDFSVSFWLYIDDFYQYHTKWRHLFHKGPHNFGSGNIIDFDDWDELTATYREQSPGCWMHPGVPKIRYVLTIKPDKQYCGIFHTKKLCEDDNNHYCSWDGSSCDLKREHLENIYKDQPVDYLDTNDGNTILQYVDIDVPVKEVCHLSFVLDQKVLNVFQNGKLIQTAKFMGDPVSNRNDLHFCLKNNFSGNLLNWTYYPDSISDERIKNEVKTLPDFEKIPEKKRVLNELKNGQIYGAIKSLF